MINLSRTGRCAVRLSLNQEGIQQLKNALEAALGGQPALLDVELSGRVVGKRWSVDTQICPCLISSVPPSQADEMTWDWESKTLRLNIDTDVIEAGIQRLADAAETGCFWPAEWIELPIDKRPEADMLYFFSSDEVV